MKILLWIIGTIFALFLAGQIFITNENLANFLYIIFYYGSIILGLFLILFVGYILIDIFGKEFSRKLNLFGYILIGITLLTITYVISYINGDNYKTKLTSLSVYLSDHVEIQKGKMPIFNIGDDINTNTGELIGTGDLEVTNN